MAFIHRQIEAPIRELLTQFPVIALTGPRQSGKTTLLKSMFPDYQYLSLEDPNTRSFAQHDPVGFLEKYNGRVIFDEAQRVPDLFSYLQAVVDKSGKMGEFILSGSQNFLLLARITQSLAERVGLFRLLPFDFEELKTAGLLPNDWKKLAVQGFYPTVHDRAMSPGVFYQNYLQTYIDRDVSELSKVHDLRRFRNFITLCAARCGQLLNLSNLANECGITQPTAKSWLAILEASYIVFKLPPYFENFDKRVVKTPKLYFYDTGLAAFLLGIRQVEDLTDQTIVGSLFENMIVGEFFKQNLHRYQLREFWFWRDANGYEIDLLTKSGLDFELFEIKSSQTIVPKFFRNLDFLAAILGEKVKKRVLVYGGNESQDRTGYSVRGWNGI